MRKQSCWIIGASHGIGEALARKYFNHGFDLMISARSIDKLNQIRNEIYNENPSATNQILVSKVDVCDVLSLQKSCDEILTEFGKIDLVIFASALYHPSKAIGFDLQKSHETIDVNLKGALNLLHVVLAKMVAQKFGHIAFIASVAGYRGLPQSFAYGASKAALINLCEGIQPELKRANIDISVINPGFVQTRLTAKNSFAMPFIISPQKAADEIFNGLTAKKFEIHFPKKFTYILKFLRILPNSIFLKIIKKIK